MASDARQGPALTITGTCEGCAHLRTSNVVLTCAHPQTRKGLTGFAIVATKAKHEDWNMRSNMRHDCPLLPAARLTLARSIVAEADRAQAEIARADIRRRMRMTPAEVMADAAAHGAGESEEQQR